MSATLPLPDFHHERVEMITGRRSGLFIAVALHSSVLGSALGGARLWTYPHWSDALGDALRLSAAMTLKNAAAGLDAGGGKSVIALPPGTPARRASVGVRRSSTSATPSSRCTGSTAPRRTSARRPRTCSTVSERTEHVVGLPDAVGGSGEPAGPTSLGVYESLRATLERVDRLRRCRRSPHHDLGTRPGRQPPRRAPRGRRCRDSRSPTSTPAKRDLALQLGADVDAPRARSTSCRPTCSSPPASAASSPTRSSTRSMPARSAAPRTTRSPSTRGAERLARRGILYAPDFVVNAGGVIYLDLEAKQLGSRERDHGPGRRDRRHRAPRLRRGGVARE